MEKYKLIKNYPNYEISKKGTVRNSIYKNILKPMITKDGYFRVGLYNEFGMKKVVIHRLVAIHFVENPFNKPEVNHKDGDKSNNNDWNLEWNTRIENMNHCDLLGLRKMPSGQNHHKSKITDKEALMIKLSNEKTSLLAKKYNVSFSTISNIKKNISRKHL